MVRLERGKRESQHKHTQTENVKQFPRVANRTDIVERLYTSEPAPREKHESQNQDTEGPITRKEKKQQADDTGDSVSVRTEHCPGNMTTIKLPGWDNVQESQQRAYLGGKKQLTIQQYPRSCHPR